MVSTMSSHDDSFINWRLTTEIFTSPLAFLSPFQRAADMLHLPRLEGPHNFSMQIGIKASDYLKMLDRLNCIIETNHDLKLTGVLNELYQYVGELQIEADDLNDDDMKDYRSSAPPSEPFPSSETAVPCEGSEQYFFRRFQDEIYGHHLSSIFRPGGRPAEDTNIGHYVEMLDRLTNICNYLNHFLPNSEFIAVVRDYYNAVILASQSKWDELHALQVSLSPPGSKTCPPTEEYTPWPGPDVETRIEELSNEDDEILLPFLKNVFEQPGGFSEANRANVDLFKDKVRGIANKIFGINLQPNFGINFQDWGDVVQYAGVRICFFDDPAKNPYDEDFKYALDSSYSPPEDEDDEDDDSDEDSD